MLKRLRLLPLLAFATLGSGCATLKTASHYQPGDPMYFSGTRMNLAALSESDDRLVFYERRDLSPPSHPWLDLPLSFAADCVLLFPRIVKDPFPQPGSNTQTGYMPGYDALP